MTEHHGPFLLDAAQASAADGRVDRARAFLAAQDYPVGVAMVEHLWRGGTSAAVIDALRQYQNPDGGFGRGLEIDISSPVSNPFAARLAMVLLCSLHEAARGTLVDGLGAWLSRTQDDGGGWHFAPEVYAGHLAPWFEDWTFPALNPSCNLVGLASALGISTPDMRSRTAALFACLATREEVRDGSFYVLLPYAEYLPTADLADREMWLDDITGNIVRTATANEFADAGHFFDLVLPGGAQVEGRVPVQVMARFVDQLLDEQADDGGWPTPYDPAWRPYVTTSAMIALARLTDGV